MLEVRFVIGASGVCSAVPIMTPPTTTEPMSETFTLFALSMSLIGVPIFTIKFLGFATSPFRVVTLVMSGSPSKTAFAMALIVATFWTMVPIS